MGCAACESYGAWELWRGLISLHKGHIVFGGDRLETALALEDSVRIEISLRKLVSMWALTVLRA